jgi:large subunit ribosomal protein L22
VCPNYGYSITGLDPDRTSVASGRDVRCSPKQAREVCHAIKGMIIEDAKTFLDNVILQKQAVPFKRFNKKQAHRKGLDRFKWDGGRFPVKSAQAVQKIIANAENNAEFKGLDLDRVRIIHAAVSRGRKIKKYIPRAFGRSSPYFKTLSHIEIVLEEE